MFFICAWTAAEAATLRVPDDYPTVVDAVAAAVAGDVIELAPGDHFGPVVVDVDLTLVGTGGSAATVLYGVGGPALQVDGADIDVVGLTFDADPGPPFVDFESADASMTDVVLTGYSGGGAAIVAVDTPLVLATALFSANPGGHLDLTDSPLTATDVDLIAGGDVFTFAVRATRSPLTFVGGSVTDHDGTAIDFDSPVSFSFVTFHRNRISIEGTGPVVVEDCEFSSPYVGPNTMLTSVGGTDVTVRRTVFDDIWSGGMIVDIEGEGLVEDSVFVDITGAYDIVEANVGSTFTYRRNVMMGSTAWYHGISAAGTDSAVVEDSEFIGNFTSYSLVSASDGGTLTFRRNLATDNEISGIVSASRQERLDVSGSEFCDNRVPYLIYLFETPFSLGQSWFGMNELTPAGFDGAVLLIEGYDELQPTEIVQNTFVGTVAGSAVGPLFGGDWVSPDTRFVNNLVVGHEGSPAIGVRADLTYNVFWDNDADLAAGAVLPATNLVADPLFDTYRPGGPCGAQDLVLLAGSPAIDAGDPAILDADGSPSDVGFTGGLTPDPLLAIDGDGDGSSARFDCDDADAVRFPGAVEACDEVDQDCDGDPSTGLVYVDLDGDGVGDDATAATGDVCDPSLVLVGGDCEDDDAAVGRPATVYADGDGDGFGLASAAVVGCPGNGLASLDGDCDDDDATRAPDVPEVCDGVDQDCDQAADDGVTGTWYTDGDGDGLGDEPSATEGCGGSGMVEVAGDCDDADAALTDDCSGAEPDPKDEAAAGGCGCASGGGTGAWLAILLAPLLRRRSPGR